jgi:hypothetical protein
MPGGKRLRLGQPVGHSQQFGEVVEGGCDVWMARPEARLANRQCPAIERFRLSVQRLRSKQPAEPVH